MDDVARALGRFITVVMIIAVVATITAVVLGVILLVNVISG